MEKKPIEATYEQTQQQAYIQYYSINAALSVLETQGLIAYNTMEKLCDMLGSMRYLYDKAISLLKEQEGAKNE